MDHNSASPSQLKASGWYLYRETLLPNYSGGTAQAYPDSLLASKYMEEHKTNIQFTNIFYYQ